MKNIFFATLIEGVRSRKFITVAILAIFLIIGALASSAFSMRQPATVALDMSISFSKLALILVSLLWVEELVADGFITGGVIHWIVYPIGRQSYIMARIFALAIMVLVVTFVFYLVSVIITTIIAGVYDQGYSPFLGCELIFVYIIQVMEVLVVISFSLMIASVAKTPNIVTFSGVLFSISCKSASAAYGYILEGAGGEEYLISYYGPVLKVLQFFIPNFDLLDVRYVSLHGKWPVWDTFIFGFIDIVLFISIFASVAAYNFSRRKID